MKKNIGKTDRIIRLVLGLAILSQTFIGAQSLWGLVGIVLIVTAFISVCPLYSILGLNTRTVKDTLNIN